MSEQHGVIYIMTNPSFREYVKIVGAIRAERFCDGALLGFLENGCVVKWLERLKQIDDIKGENHE